VSLWWAFPKQIHHRGTQFTKVAQRVEVTPPDSSAGSLNACGYYVCLKAVNSPFDANATSCPEEIHSLFSSNRAAVDNDGQFGHILSSPAKFGSAGANTFTQTAPDEFPRPITRAKVPGHADAHSPTIAARSLG